jgi:hypothetical protein
MRRAIALLIGLWSAPLAAETPPKIEPPKDKSAPVLMVTAATGTGLRFNNPFRLSTVLGDDAESVSRTSFYGDLGLAATLGSPLGAQHGLAFRWSFALEGVSHSVITPSYLLWRRWSALALYGRAGIPIIVWPRGSWGAELGAGAAYFVRGGLGVTGEVVGSVFYGAGTREVATPAYPVLSAQLGIVAAYEVLP